MYIKYSDSEKNVTYLKLGDNYTYDELQDMCYDYYLEHEPSRDQITEMDFVDWGIRLQYMTILSDEESQQVENEINESRKKGKGQDDQNISEGED